MSGDLCHGACAVVDTILFSEQKWSGLGPRGAILQLPTRF